MSRIGKQPILIPNGVSVNIGKSTISVKGSKGTLERVIPPHVKISQEQSTLLVKPLGNEKRNSAFQGLTRSLVANMVTGVSEGYKKKMQIEGVGYRVVAEGKNLVFHLGYSSPVNFELPKEISAEIEGKGLVFTINGIDKELVGQTAATIRELRAPEPYKGKGIRYADEHIRRKAGKAGVK